MQVSCPSAGKRRLIVKKIQATEYSNNDEHRRGFRLESRPGELCVVASLSGVNRCGKGKPMVHSLHAVVRGLPMVPDQKELGLLRGRSGTV